MVIWKINLEVGFSNASEPLQRCPGASAVLLQQHFGSAAAPEFSVACHAATAGNPFFLGELCRSLQAAGVAPTAEAVARVADEGPGAVARSVLLRTAGLSSAAWFK